MKITTDWYDILKDEYKKKYFVNLEKFLADEYKNETIYPAKDDIFNALNYTSFADTNVVILGQDPYHGKDQAHGLSFSIKSDEAKFAPSLRNIFKEMESDIGVKREKRNLQDWAEQGVLLLNTVFTVRDGKAGSHRNKGWEKFSEAIIKALNEKETPVIYVLWGNDAKSKKSLITNELHKTIESVHPSPLSANGGFFGSKPFSQIDTFLKENNLSEIVWA